MEDESLEPLKSVSNVIELKPDKEYLLVFHGIPREATLQIVKSLQVRGISGIGIALSDGESLQVVELPMKEVSDAPGD